MCTDCEIIPYTVFTNLSTTFNNLTLNSSLVKITWVIYTNVSFVHEVINTNHFNLKFDLHLNMNLNSFMNIDSIICQFTLGNAVIGANLDQSKIFIVKFVNEYICWTHTLTHADTHISTSQKRPHSSVFFHKFIYSRLSHNAFKIPLSIKSELHIFMAYIYNQIFAVPVTENESTQHISVLHMALW